MYVTPEDKVRNFIDEGVVFYVSLTNLKSQIGKNERFSIHHYAVEERWSICRAERQECDGSNLCWNRSELECKKDEMMSDTLLVMKYIRKKKEIDYFGMSINGKVYIDFNDEISRFPDGAYGYYGAFMRCKNDETYQKCVSMMEEIGYNGLFDIEFLLGDDDVLYFMEINFRADGAIYKLAEGVNLPAAWCELACSTELPECLPTKKDFFVGMTEVQDFKLNVLTGRMNPFKWFWQFCTADRHMLFNLKDPKPILVRLLSLFPRRRA